MSANSLVVRNLDHLLRLVLLNPWVRYTKVDVRSPFFYRARPDTLPFMDEKLMVATEGLLKASLERLFQTLRSKRASKEARIRGILEFHFTNQAAVRSFLEDMGMIEE
jgi:hypothetical protein